MKKNFTVVEMLAVIFIIVIIGALGAYTISYSLEAARSVKCINNLNQQGVAFLQCVSSTPLTGYPGLSGNLMPKVEDAQGQSWIEKLKPYGAEDPEIFICPQTDSKSQPSYGMNPLALAGWSYQKQRFTGALLMPEEEQPCNYDLLANPGNTVLINDTAEITADTAKLEPQMWIEENSRWLPYTAFSLSNSTPGPGGSVLKYGYDWGNDAPGNMRGGMKWDPLRRAIGRHPDFTCGSLFADGHAQMLEISELVGHEWGSDGCLFDNK